MGLGKLSIVGMVGLVLALAMLPRASGTEWPYITAAVSTTAVDDRLIVAVTLYNRFDKELRDIMVHIQPPPGGSLMDCWAGGGRGANPCSALRSDNTAKWWHPDIKPGKYDGPFIAEWRISADAPDEGDVPVWYRWHGQWGGEYIHFERTTLKAK